MLAVNPQHTVAAEGCSEAFNVSVKWLGRQLSALGDAISKVASKVWTVAKDVLASLGEHASSAFASMKDFVSANRREVGIAVAALAVGAVLYAVFSKCCRTEVTPPPAP